jgi:hypothetical protein
MADVRRVLAVILASVAMARCASTQTEHVRQPAEDRGVVRNNKSQPAWASDLTKGQENGKHYVVKMVERVYRLDVGIEQAKTQAMGEAAQLVGSKIAKVATAAVSGDNSADEGVSQSIDSAVHAVSALSMTGIEQADIYWEEIKAEPGKKNHFNVYILLSIPSGEVERAKKLFLSRISENVKLDAIKEKVERAVEALD